MKNEFMSEQTTTRAKFEKGWGGKHFFKYLFQIVPGS
jgi:hypothetical protein